MDLTCDDSTLLKGRKPFDGIFTDPPYFGNVQYAELMDFCYVWLRKLAGAALAPRNVRHRGDHGRRIR